MQLGKRIMGGADLTFEFFSNGGFIGFKCSNCQTELKVDIQIYRSGILLDELDSIDGYQTVIEQLLKLRVVNLHQNNQFSNAQTKYELWNMDALYDTIECHSCAKKHFTVYGMAELQPGREEVQFKGVFELLSGQVP